jgi:hypothetical protein
MNNISIYFEDRHDVPTYSTSRLAKYDDKLQVLPLTYILFTIIWLIIHYFLTSTALVTYYISQENFVRRCKPLSSLTAVHP